MLAFSMSPLTSSLFVLSSRLTFCSAKAPRVQVPQQPEELRPEELEPEPEEPGPVPGPEGPPPELPLVHPQLDLVCPPPSTWASAGLSHQEAPRGQGAGGAERLIKATAASPKHASTATNVKERCMAVIFR
eukprot:CAMPEP_0184289610 /NCGR_PEP_ID=MMETSP1049-20130417/2029_1 /TAXON_ID=77928 /ORGANISM="Proteomonas sulcata, Strain CCMP704" /LENGTH=130 /DNA_ID=CAMNT_0026596477 /DNA_START=849 /DNA_END=1237 /DNA_ORIENTATION=+